MIGFLHEQKFGACMVILIYLFFEGVILIYLCIKIIKIYLMIVGWKLTDTPIAVTLVCKIR